MGLIRVSDSELGRHYTIGEAAFDPKRHTRLNQPAVDSFGHPLPPKFKQNLKSGTRDTDATTKKES